MAGRIPIVAVGVPAAGLRGGWRDYCIVNAPERRVLGASVVLRALVSRRAFVVAKRGAVPVSKREPQAPPPPVAKHRAVEGLRRSCAWARSVWLRARSARSVARVAGELWWLSTPPRAEWLTLTRRGEHDERSRPPGYPHRHGRCGWHCPSRRASNWNKRREQPAPEPPLRQHRGWRGRLRPGVVA